MPVRQVSRLGWIRQWASVIGTLTAPLSVWHDGRVATWAGQLPDAFSVIPPEATAVFSRWICRARRQRFNRSLLLCV